MTWHPWWPLLFAALSGCAVSFEYYGIAVFYALACLLSAIEAVMCSVTKYLNRG